RRNQSSGAIQLNLAIARRCRSILGLPRSGERFVEALRLQLPSSPEVLESPQEIAGGPRSPALCFLKVPQPEHWQRRPPLEHRGFFPALRQDCDDRRLLRQSDRAGPKD